MVRVQLEAAAIVLVVDVVDLDAPVAVGIVVAAAVDLQDDQVVVLQEMGKKEMLDGKNDVQVLLLLVMGWGMFLFVFEWQVSLLRSGHIDRDLEA
jgi:hypothetical protein